MTKAPPLIAIPLALALCSPAYAATKSKTHKPSTATTTTAPVASAAPAAASDPVKQVETFHAALLDSMKSAKSLGVQGRYNKLAPAVDASFDFPAMTQAIVGPDWASMSETDRKSIIDRSEERRVGKECRSRWSPY